MSLVVPVPIIAERTRDLIAPISDYSLYLCHDGAGTTLTDSAPAAQQLFGDLTINGTTAGIWATEGNFTPAGDHTIQKNSALNIAVGDISTLSGQLIFFVDVYATAAPSTNYNTFLSYGSNGSADGYRFMILQTSGRPQISHRDHAGVQVNAPYTQNICDSVRHCFVGVIDAANAVLTPYLDGVAGTSVAIDAANLCQSHAWGFGIFANITAATPAFNAPLGGAGIAGLYINRIGLMRTTSDQTNNLGSIASGLAEIAHELPWALDGV